MRDTRALTSMPHPPKVLFRILHDGGPNLSPTPGFNENGDLPARDPGRDIDFDSVNDHLSYTRRNTPFLSFCTREKAGRWIKHLRNQNARNITLIAIDSSSMVNILNAHSLAQELGYYDGSGHRRRQLRNHLGEYLVYGGYSADSYKLLTVIPLLNAQLNVPNAGDLDAEIYIHTGRYNRDNRERLRRSLSAVSAESRA